MHGKEKSWVGWFSLEALEYYLAFQTMRMYYFNKKLKRFLKICSLFSLPHPKSYSYFIPMPKGSDYWITYFFLLLILEVIFLSSTFLSDPPPPIHHGDRKLPPPP